MSYLPSNNNGKVREVLRNLNSEMLKVPKYEQFYPDSRAGMIRKNKEEIAIRSKNRLQKIKQNFQQEIDAKKFQIEKIKYGNLVNKSYTPPANRVIGATEYNSALQLWREKPKNIRKIIELAAEQGRGEFIFSLENFFTDDESSYSKLVSQYINEAKDILGVSKIEYELRELEDFQAETDTLLSLSVEELESRANSEVYASEQMKQHEQIEES